MTAINLDFNKKIIIGISGKLGTGKDTVAKFIKKKINDYKINNVPLTTSIISFGDPLKNETSTVYKFHKKLCYTQEGKESYIEFEMLPNDPRIPPNSKKIGINTYKNKVRIVLQWYGTDVKRKEDPNYWLKMMDQEILRLKNDPTIIIIPDVRFINEFNYISKKPNNFNFRLEPYKNYIYGKNSNHASETELDPYLNRFDCVFNPSFGTVHLKNVANDIYDQFIYNKCKELFDNQNFRRIMRSMSINM